ncbi:TPA: hypothetical protein HA219_00740, partial [Candidatus Woesearchaeota archaeon]|nr:hypothetical protein [Candidatus Woesearchaeota archaeon]
KMKKSKLNKKGDLLDAFEPLIMPIAVLIAIIVIAAIVIIILGLLK